jgi:hypothetical protein
MATSAHYLVKLERLTVNRCREVAEFIAERSNANAPHRKPENVRQEELTHVPLHEAYYAEPDTHGWVVRSKVPYWKYVEFGTSKHGSAQPHVRVAVDQAKERYG